MTIESGKLKIENEATQKKAWHRRVFCVALAAFSIFNCQFSIAQSSDSLIVHYTDGVRLAVEDRYDEALEKFREALALDSDHDPSLFEAANIFAMRGETEQALEYSARAAALDPENRWYKGQQVRLLAALDRYDEALAVCEGMVGEGMDFDPDSYSMLAMLYYRKRRTDDALATLDSVAVRMGASPQIVEMKRGILLEAGRIDEAVAVTEEYIAAVPYDEDNRLALAEIYGYQRRDSLQTEMLREVIGINPDNERALGALSDLYLSRGHTALFVATLKQLFTLPGVPLERKKARLEMLTGNENFYRNNFFEVGELVTALMAAYPSDTGVTELYVDHAMHGGDPEGALAILKSRLGKPDPQSGLFVKSHSDRGISREAGFSGAVERSRAGSLSRRYPDIYAPFERPAISETPERGAEDPVPRVESGGDRFAAQRGVGCDRYAVARGGKSQKDLFRLREGVGLRPEQCVGSQ